jgi:carbon storage regulator
LFSFIQNITVLIGSSVKTEIKRRNIMLVLSRKSGQCVVIGHDITVMVLKVHGSQVKLGISGPKHIPIHRKEVFRKIAKDAWPRELVQMM